jgi:thiol-disulfide isomerase/thioredoxin
MKISKKMIYNILFYGLIIFILTPYGRPKFLQAISYVKSIIISPSIPEDENRIHISDMNLDLKGIANATDINLNDAQGKVIFLNYWATWCPPCRAEMPSIQQLYNDYKDKMVFVFITNEPKEKVVKYYSEKNHNFPTYSLLSNPAPEISTRSLPTTFIIDKQGKIVAKEIGASNWNSSGYRKMFDALLAE